MSDSWRSRVTTAGTTTDPQGSPGAAALGTPVFVDDSGRRRRRARRWGRLLGLLCLAYLALVGASFARAPWLSRILLPGVAELLPLPAPQVADPAPFNSPSSAPALPSPGSQATTNRAKPPTTTGLPGRTTTPAAATIGSAQPIAPGNEPAPAVPAPSGTPAAPGGPGGQTMTPTTTATTTTTAAHGPSKSEPTSSTSTSTPASPTTTPTTTAASQPGQGSSTASPNGPDGQGPPGQLRKSTSTTTTAPGR